MAMYRSRWLCIDAAQRQKKIRQSFGGQVEGVTRGVFDWGEPSDLPMYPATTHQSIEKREPNPRTEVSLGITIKSGGEGQHAPVTPTSQLDAEYAQRPH
jgi:hypothetical protein